MTLMIKLLIKKLLRFFVNMIDKIFPSAFDGAFDRFVVHKIDYKKCFFLNLGLNSRNRSRQAFFKEPDTMKWIDTFEENSTFMDIGSNIGAFSIYAAIKRSCRVYSFEGSINANYIFLINIAKNKLKNLVSLYPVLLSDSKGKFLQTSAPNDTLDNLSGFQFMNSEKHKINSSLNHASYYISFQTIESINFDKSVNHLKIDVDGNEKKVLDACIPILKQLSLKSIMIELDKSNDTTNDIIEMLLSFGFKIDNSFKHLTKVSAKPFNQRYNNFFKRISYPNKTWGQN